MLSFFLGLGSRWAQVATYLGFTSAEITGIGSAHPDNVESQVWFELRVIGSGLCVVAECTYVLALSQT